MYIEGDLPKQFGRYVLTHAMAAGGMAQIYKGKIQGSEGFERELVVKCILPVWNARSEFIEMFIDEAKILAQLSHPNIVQVYEFNKQLETYYLAMELIDGMDLRNLHRKVTSDLKTIPHNIICYILSEALSGLHYAHQKCDAWGKPLHIVHRDMSPQNILISWQGEVKVSDFGIALASERHHETETGVLKGKYSYMAPEQALGNCVDARTDIYAVGLILFELLLGQKAFGNGSHLQILNRARLGEIEWPESFNKLSPLLQKILQKALAQNPQARYESAAAFAKELRAFAKVGRIDLVVYLNSLQEDVTHTLTNPTLTKQESFSLTSAVVKAKTFSVTKSKKVKPMIGSGLLLMLVMIMLGYSGDGQNQNNLIGQGVLLQFPSVLSRASLPVAVVDVLPEVKIPVIKQAEKEKVVEKVTNKKSGAVIISAVPWGKVSISGIVNKATTPYRASNLKNGYYQVQVFQGPGVQTNYASINITDGKIARCSVNFEKSRQLVCR